MIKRLIDQELYEEALRLLENKNDDESIYQKIVCLYGLKRFDDAYFISKNALECVEKNYYDILCLHISILLELEKENEALELIESELEMPYIPQKYDNFLNETYEMLYRKNLQNSKTYNIYDTLNDSELKDILISSREKDVLLIVLDQLQKRNVRLYLNELKYILKTKDCFNDVKVIILEILAEQGVDQEIEILCNGKLIEVNPVSLTPLMEQLAIDEIIAILNEKINDKDVSIFNLCGDFIIAYLASIYPLEVEEDEYYLVACGAYYSALTVLNIEEDFTKVCKLFDVKEEFAYPYYEEMYKINNF